jgi:hypothetical protein
MNVSLLQWTDWVERRVKNKEFSSASECIRHCIQVADSIERVSGPAGASFSTRAELEDILEEGFPAPAGPLTQDRKRRIAKNAGLRPGKLFLGAVGSLPSPQPPTMTGQAQGDLPESPESLIFWPHEHRR